MKKEKIYLKIYLNKKDGRAYIASFIKNGELCYSEISDFIPELVNADNETVECAIERMRPIMESLASSILDTVNMKNVDIVQVYLKRKSNKFLEYFNQK